MNALGSILRQIKRDTKASLSDLTVLSATNDPFRLDTPTFRIAGKWFRDKMEECGLLGRGRPIHLRGIHYALVSHSAIVKPDGVIYRNIDEDWTWLQNAASKAARWHGYVPFDAIIDARNEEPIIRKHEHTGPSARISLDAEIYLPDAGDLEPRIEVDGFIARQAYKFVFYGEKTSLAEVLEPLSAEYKADLYLPAGEISDTLLARMAKDGADDGRPMVVFIFADCDPAGYQMAVSIGHKLRALRERFHPSLEFRLTPPALTVEQVKSLGLPSTPLKESEKRADGWRSKHGVEQTEIDALATLRPDDLRRIVREAVAPYWDLTLEARVRDAKLGWREAAQEAFDAQVNPDYLAQLKALAEAELESVRYRIQEISTVIDHAAIDLPPFEVPEPIINDDLPEPLVSSDMDLIDAIRVLRDRKRYGKEED